MHITDNDIRLEDRNYVIQDFDGYAECSRL